MHNKTLKKVLALGALLAVLLAGCRLNVSIGSDSFLTGEAYPNAEAYQTGAFTYDASAVKAVEVYWRSGEVLLIESESATLSAMESGSDLPEEAAMHSLLDDGVLRIRFCASEAKIRVNSADKHLRLEIPKGIDLSIHTTSALVKADALAQNDLLIAALSGDISLGTVTADRVDLSGSSGSIQISQLSAPSLKCRTSSGSIDLGSVSAKTLECAASSGSVAIRSILADEVSVTTSSGRVELALANASTISVRTSSGTVCAMLPENGAEVSFTSNSGRLRTDRTYTRKGDLYVFGNGASQLSVETSIGNLEIR